MARGPKPAPLHLTDDERMRLVGLVRRRKVSMALAQRARIVLACAEPGATNNGVARDLGVSWMSVTTWRARFLAHRLDGLVDLHPSGAPRAVAGTTIDGMITLTLESQPELDMHLVLDNAATHKTKMIHDWLVKRPRWHLPFTPTSASWLNLVKGWFALLNPTAAATRRLRTNR